MSGIALPPVEVTGPAAAASMAGPWGAAISGGLNLLGGLIGNRSSAKQAQQQMEFQERMRATQYQTAVQDLKKAGLNPMLAYTQGGAGTPSGAQASQQNVLGPAANSAIDAYTAITTAEQTKEQTNAIIMGRMKMLEEISLLREQQESTSSATSKINAEIDQLRQQLLTQQLEYAGKKETFSSDVQRRKDEAKLTAHQLPEAESFAKMWSSPYGKNVAPYLNSAGSLTDIVKKAGSIMFRR